MGNNWGKENRIGRGWAVVRCGTSDSRVVATQIRYYQMFPRVLFVEPA